MKRREHGNQAQGGAPPPQVGEPVSFSEDT